MPINLFQWVREGVRQSVLLGVADAVEDLGSPDGKDKFSKSIRDFARQNVTESDLAGSPTRRRRLGKSLKDINPAEKATS